MIHKNDVDIQCYLMDQDLFGDYHAIRISLIISNH